MNLKNYKDEEMKKVLLFLTFFAITLLAAAQNPIIDKLKKELEGHPQQDTIRVNLLNDLAAQSFLNLKERKEYAEEALAISRKAETKDGEGSEFKITLPC